MNSSDIQSLALVLDRARLDAREIPRITEKHPELTLRDAYRIQLEGVRLRATQGEKIVGYKMGLTSEAKRKQMNLDSPCFGVLTDAMSVPDGGTFSLQGKIHPKIEPEIAFRTNRELRGRITREQALAACSGVFAALEILDSRFVGFKYFSLPDVVADNSSSAFFVTSSDESVDPRTLDLPHLEMRMLVNGQLAQAAPSSAISGDPLLSVVQLSALLDEHDLALPAGSLVLAGAATAAVQLKPGMKIELQVSGLRPVTVVVGHHNANSVTHSVR